MMNPLSLLKQFTLQFQPLHRHLGKVAFLKKIKKNGKLLDVGCGNNSPNQVKFIRPDLFYVGLDVCEYNQSSNYAEIADEMIITQPENFVVEIENRSNQFDGILSAHNLEHCDEPFRVLEAMSKALTDDGLLYISCPSELSVNFPRDKKNILNFYDDPSHQNVINFEKMISILKSNQMGILVKKKQYKPFIFFGIGLILEPFRKYFGIKISRAATWAFWGFETVIIAQKTPK